MNKTINRSAIALGTLAAIASVTVIAFKTPQVTAQAQSQSSSKVVNIDGFSTVFPITKAIAKEFQFRSEKAQIQVDFSGTSSGFKKEKPETHAP